MGRRDQPPSLPLLTERETETVAVASPPDLLPLELHRTGNHLVFAFAPREDILPELPRDYEELLAAGLLDVLQEPAALTAEINLQDTPALSSRQIGSLIALQRVLRPRFERIPITGLSDGVRHVLGLMRVDRLFAID